MIRINLLPHRELRRKAQRTQFFITLGVVVAIGAGIWFGVHTYLEDQFDRQVARNRYLESEIKKLDAQIAEIQKLKDQIAALKARARVVESLQGTRSEVVHLLDQLVRQLPDGVYLKGIKQTNNRVQIMGYTQSQARVSTLMRNLDSSPQLESPGLIEIKSVNLKGQRTNEFTMNVNITRAQPPAATSTAAKSAGKK
jgi:type IV pilus assembly protein PilN